MYRFHILLVCILFSFLSCEKKKKEKKKQEFSFIPPITINATNPIIIELDSCPKPNIITFPAKGSSHSTIQTPDGPKAITLTSTTTPILAGEAGGFTYMQNYNTEQGLGLNTIWCGFKDKRGNLWFGTFSGGVSKYDGQSFTTFTTAQGLASNMVKCIIEDRAGNLWFGTNGGGVSKYDGKSFTNFAKEQGLANNRVLSITEDKSGNLWFSTNDGISRLSPNSSRFTNYTTAQGLASNYVTVSITDKKGNLWFGTAGGISKYNPSIKAGSGAKLFTNYTTAQGLAANNITSILEDKSGNMWFGTESGLSRLKVGGASSFFTNFTTAQGLLSDHIASITEDKSGNIWFGTGLGLSRLSPNTMKEGGASLFTNFTTAQGLSNNAVLSITEDKTGSLWFGTNGGGVSRYDGKSFRSFTSNEGLIQGKLWGITEDRNANLWFVANDGIGKYYGRQSLPTEQTGFTNFTEGLTMAKVRCVTEDKRGNIWFGSALGVSKYDPSDKLRTGKESFTNYTMAQGLAHNAVLSVAEDKTGNMWFGTYGGGVSKYDGKSFTNFTTKQGLAGNVIKCILEDKRGNMWFGTNENGLSKYDGKAFTNYSRAQGLAHATIYSMMEDKAGYLWFGTAGGGVCKYNPLANDSMGSKPFTTYSTAHGLANDVVYAIVEDTLNNIIWFGTNLGLSGLKLNSLSQGVEGAKFENFNQSSGYPIKDLNTGALFLDKKGILWAGTSEKLVRFDYSGVHKSTEPPAVFIQALKIQGENISWYNLKSEADSLAILNEEITINSRSLTVVQRDAMRKKFGDIKFDSIARFYPVPVNLVLPFKHNNVTFDFLAIETARPFMVKYQYMLEGYDNDWSPVTDKTTATFGNIYEGTYTLKLKARSPEGVWSDLVIYTFKVLPPWQRTWWAYLVYLLIGSFLIWLVYRWRVAALLKEKKLLEDTVKVRTQELAEKTIVAEQQKEIAEAQREVATAQKHIIEEKQKEILDSIHYASRIQQALLTGEEYIREHLIGSDVITKEERLKQSPSDNEIASSLRSGTRNDGRDYFILFKPKDIVAGDFYWAHSAPPPLGEAGRGLFYIATCDCTGHGVPGAFMSMLNINFLNENVIERGIKMPDEILNTQRSEIIKALNPKGNENSKDGMDCVLCAFDFKKMLLHFAAANNPLWLVRKKSLEFRVESSELAENNSELKNQNFELIVYKADKMPVGKYNEDTPPFTLQTIELQKGDVIYTATDGFADQFGATNGKKLMKKTFKEELLKIHLQPMSEQKKYLNQFFENWKGNTEQIDDVCVIGIRI